VPSRPGSGPRSGRLGRDLAHRPDQSLTELAQTHQEIRRRELGVDQPEMTLDDRLAVGRDDAEDAAGLVVVPGQVDLGN
jgi:hypothetical protein